MTNDNARVYVSTYAKYSNGILKGAWLSLDSYTSLEEFNDACVVLHADEVNPEFMLQDFEGIPRIFCTESSLDARVFEWLALDEHDREIVDAFLECIGDSPNVFENSLAAYQGQYDNDADFAYECVESTGMLQGVAESIKRYFDYDAFARDLMFDYSSHNNYYFSTNW